jgi:hypothetical protein
VNKTDTLNIPRVLHGIQNNPEDACVGAFSVTIYNHFGVLHVPAWGREYSCREEAYEFLEEKQNRGLMWEMELTVVIVRFRACSILKPFTSLVVAFELGMH